MEISWDWIPGVSVGPFGFGNEAATPVARFGLVKLEPDCAGADWDTYEMPRRESRVMIHDGKIRGVLCCDRLTYQGEDLLGQTLDGIRRLLGNEDEVEKDAGLGEAVYYYRIGLTLWFAEGVVRSATCNAPM
jgi:hypothetical protein